MRVPEITHLQFLLLNILLDGEQKGRLLRKQLAEAGQSKSGPAFYQFMARLEDARMAEGRYEQKVIDGQIIKERVYKITDSGRAAWEHARSFYAELTRTRHGLLGA